MLQSFMQFLKVFVYKNVGKYVEKKAKAILKCSNTEQKQICM
jgi:hypothetical protein